MGSWPEYVSQISDCNYRLKVWIQPGAKKNEIVGTYQDCLKVKIKAPPVDNKANKELITFLAKSLHLKTNQIYLEGGKTSRKKVIIISIKTLPNWLINRK